MELIESYQEEIFGPHNAVHQLSIEFFAVDDQEKLQIHIKIGSYDQEDLITIVLKARIVNPFIIDDLLVSAASGYAICVAKGAANCAVPLAYTSYCDSKKEIEETLGFFGRVRDIAKRFISKKDELIGAIVSSLTLCGIWPS